MPPGIWGAIATGLFALKGFNPDASLDAVQWNGLVFGQWQLFLRQLAAVGITIVIAVAGTLIALWIAKLCTKGLRVSEAEEEAGLDISEHGETAYASGDGNE